MFERATIRPATLSDVAQMIALDQESDSAAHWSPESYRTIFADDSPKRIALVAEQAGRLAAFVVALTATSEWEIENLVTAPDVRRRGLAASLINEITRQAKVWKAEGIFLEVRKSNRVARSFYGKMRFKESGSRTAYYNAPTEDAILYRLLLQ